MHGRPSIVGALLDLLRGTEPLAEAMEEFSGMLDDSQEMVLEGSAMYMGRRAGPREVLLQLEERLHERMATVRADVIVHLVGSEVQTLTLSLQLAWLVKDLERIGDYAKNLARAAETCGLDPAEGLSAFAEDPLVVSVRAISADVEALSRQTPDVFLRADDAGAKRLCEFGDDIGARCDAMLSEVAAAERSSQLTTYLVLGIRHYKRIQGHYASLLRSVLLPFDRLDVRRRG